MKSDEQLMLEHQAGSPPAFEELFSRYRNAVYGFFRRRLNNAARAEELAQENASILGYRSAVESVERCPSGAALWPSTASMVGRAYPRCVGASPLLSRAIQLTQPVSFPQLVRLSSRPAV